MVDKLVEELESIRTFRVDADDYNWMFSYPDVILEIILDAPPTYEQTLVVVSTLEAFVQNYNKRHFFRPIHYVSDIDHLPRGDHAWGIYVHMDFGRSPATALVSAVKELEKTGLPIFRVALLW